MHLYIHNAAAEIADSTPAIRPPRAPCGAIFLAFEAYRPPVGRKAIPAQKTRKTDDQGTTAGG